MWLFISQLTITDAVWSFLSYVVILYWTSFSLVRGDLLNWHGLPCLHEAVNHTNSFLRKLMVLASMFNVVCSIAQV